MKRKGNKSKYDWGNDLFFFLGYKGYHRISDRYFATSWVYNWFPIFVIQRVLGHDLGLEVGVIIRMEDIFYLLIVR
jgi:hypothetical protein